MRGEFSDGEIWTDVDYRQCKRNGTPASRWNTVTLSYTNAYYNPYDQDDYTLYFGAHRVDYKGGWFNPS